MSLAGLHVEQSGEGPAIVLAHGFAGSARNWRPQVRALRDRYEVFSYDARGHARSDAPDDPKAYGSAAMVADLASLVAEAGPAAPVVGGLSMGAATVLAWALANPAGARALILASYPADRASGRGVSAHAEAFAEALDREGIDAAGARFAWGPDSGLDERGAAWVRQGFLEHSAHGLAHILRGFLGPRPALAEWEPQLRALDLPVLLVAGGGDPGSLAPCRWLAEILPGAHLEIVPEAGHVVNLVQPAAFNQRLDSFLEGLPIS